MEETISRMQKKKKIDTTLQIITCIHNDYEKAIKRAKKTLSFYIAVGKIYREFLQSTGYSEETGIIYEEYKKGGLNGLDEFVSDKMLDDLCIAGTPDVAVKKLNAFQKWPNVDENMLESDAFLKDFNRAKDELKNKPL